MLEISIFDQFQFFPTTRINYFDIIFSLLQSFLLSYITVHFNVYFPPPIFVMLD